MRVCFGACADPETINAMLIVSNAISQHLLLCVNRTGNSSCAEKVASLQTLPDGSVCDAFKSAGCCLAELYNLHSAVYDATFETQIDRCSARSLVLDRCVAPTSAPTVLPSVAPSSWTVIRRLSAACPHPTIDFATVDSCWALWRVFALEPSQLSLVSEQHAGQPLLGACPSIVGTVSARTLSGEFKLGANPTAATAVSFKLSCDSAILTLDMNPPGMASSARCQLQYRVDLGTVLGCGPPVPCKDDDDAAWFEFAVSSCSDLVRNETDPLARCAEPAVRTMCPVSCGRTLCGVADDDAACAPPDFCDDDLPTSSCYAIHA